jgi:DNA-binding PadR family transcriptional regulator
MLEPLIASKNIQTILLFLLVNGKCYGTELARTFGAALTPIQKALDRLENGGILTSYYEGKTRLYQFNPACLFLEELQQLLKKAYSLLPHQEKRRYLGVKRESNLTPKNAQETLLHFWQKLTAVRNLTFNAKSKSTDGGWNGRGKGEVQCTHEEPNALIFQERGVWLSKDNQETNFSNVFRFSLDRRAGLISLEHLRYGPERPVFLFFLAPTSHNKLTSIDSHFCNDDTYFGQLTYDQTSLKLSFRVIGPKKNEELDYVYY